MSVPRSLHNDFNQRARRSTGVAGIIYFCNISRIIPLNWFDPTLSRLVPSSQWCAVGQVAWRQGREHGESLGIQRQRDDGSGRGDLHRSVEATQVQQGANVGGSMRVGRESQIGASERQARGGVERRNGEQSGRRGRI